jgi:hypothetical protein
VADAKTLAAIAAELEPQKPEPEPKPEPKPKSKATFVVTAAFSDGEPREVEGLSTRSALNKQVNAFLSDGARFVQISPEN